MLKSLAIALMLFTFHPHVVHASDDQQIECLTKIIFFEARGTDYNEKIRIGNVIVNRLHNKAFPETYCKVMRQTGQFTWINDIPSTSRQKMISKEYKTFQYCRGLATILYYGMVPDTTHGALFFHANDGIPRTWIGNLKRIMTTKDHVYYKFNRR